MAILRINLKDEVPARQTRAMQGLLKLVVGVDYIKKAKDMWGDGYDALKFEYLSILRTNIETGSEYKSEPPIIEELKERPDKEVWTDMVNWLIMISKCTVIDESVLMDRPKRPLNDISMENMYKNHVIQIIHRFPDMTIREMEEDHIAFLDQRLKGIALN